MKIESPETISQNCVYVVALGSGLEPRYNGEVLYPCLAEKARIIAALEILKERDAKHLVFTGGDVYRIGKRLADISGDYAQKDHFWKHVSGDEVTISKIDAQSTVEEMEKIYGLQLEDPGSHIIVVSNIFHKVAEKLCEEFGFEFVPAEIVLKGRYNSELISAKIDGIIGSIEYNNLIRDQNIGLYLLSLPLGRQMYKILSGSFKRLTV